MRVWRPYLEHPDGRPNLRLIRAANSICAVYLLAALMPLLAWSIGHAGFLAMGTHVTALGCASWFAIFNKRERFRVIRDWLPLVLVAFMYVELRWIIAGTHFPHHDFDVRYLESAVFHGNPSATLAVRFNWLALSEALHLAYLSYYPLIVVPPLLLWSTEKRPAFDAAILALVLVYVMCFVTYIFYPVDGPRYISGPADAPAGFIRNIVLAVLTHGSSRGTAFPSSHVAASVVATAVAFRIRRGAGIVASLLTAGIAAGAVFGGYHYALDVIAGGAYGVAALLFATKLGLDGVEVAKPHRLDHVKVHVMRARIDRHHRHEEGRRRTTATHESILDGSADDDQSARS